MTSNRARLAAVSMPILSILIAGSSVKYQYSRSERLTQQLRHVSSELKRLDKGDMHEHDEDGHSD